MISIRAVVFDIGGVLEITPATGWPSGRNVRSLTGWQYCSISLSDVHFQTAEILSISEVRVNTLMDDVWSEYLGSLTQALYDYFKSLRAKYQTTIPSNSFVGAREKEQAFNNFENSCDFIIFSHEVGMSKPDTRIYALTCERLELEPDQIVFLDDTKEMIDAAKAFGMQCVLFEETGLAITESDKLLQRMHD